MKINVDHLVLIYVITLLLLYIVALVFYHVGRDDIAKEIARILELLYEFVIIPVVILTLALYILTITKTFEKT